MQKENLASNVLHASNAMMEGRENTGRLLHDLLDAGLNESSYQDWQATEFNDLIWAQWSLLTLPPVMWGVGDTLAADKPEGHQIVRNWCLLPTTTSLDTTSKLVAAAKSRFNPVHFEELKTHAPGTLGHVFLSSRGGTSMDALIHLVCREPGDPTIHALDACFSNLPKGLGIQYVLPIWRAKEQMDLWVLVIGKWIRPERYSGLKSRQPLVIRFDPSEREVGVELERRLIISGILVGRQGEHDAHNDLSQVDASNAFHQDLADLVRSTGPFKPEIYSAWVNSGVRMPTSAWDRHLHVLLNARS